MLTRRAFLSLLTLTAPIALASCKPYAPPPTAKTEVTLTLKWLFDPGFGGEMVAAKSGLFEKENLQVTLQPGGFEIDPIRLVAGGASQFGVAGADSFLIARSKGIPIVAIGAGYIRTPVAYYYKGTSSIRTVKDLRGKKIGLQAGQDTETLLYAMLGQAGIDRSSVSFVPVKYDLSPFLRGDIDVWPGYVATQSYVLRKQGVQFGMIRPQDEGLNLPGTVYFTSEKFLKEHPDLVAGFVKAVKSGWETTYRDPATAVKLISSFDTRALPEELVLQNLRDQRDQVLPDGYSYLELRRSDWDKLAAILRSQGLLEGPVNLDDALKPVK